jgi:glycosyltransferase involved in cell wall biosynthesis
MKGYGAYRDSVVYPWPLDCCGMGPLASMLAGREGVTDSGFVQPAEMKRHWRKAGAFVIPSRFDPWPLALVEAAASGLPVIASDACGSADEVLRRGSSGLVVPAGSARALAVAMAAIQQRHGELPAWGNRSRAFAAPFSAETWAGNWIGHIRATLDERATRNR